MELKQARLTNVRNFTKKVFDFNGNAEIVMPNEGGKSTLADAITFVLIGKLYSGTTDIQSLKPLSNTQAEVSIELVYDNNGQELSLMKTYKENWVKTRGTTEVTMSGHITDCFINEKKMTVSNYEKELCGYFNVDSTKELNILLNPYYFGQVMSWQERLEYVTKVTGEVTVDDVIDIAKETIAIRNDLLRYGSDLKNHLHKDTADKKKIVEETQIQIKGDSIEEVVTEKEFKAATDELNKNNNSILNLKIKKEGINDPVLESLKAQRLEQLAKIEQSKDADRKELAKKNESINNKIDKYKEERLAKYDRVSVLKNEIGAINNDIRAEERNIRDAEGLIPRKRAELSQIKVDYNNTKTDVFKPLEEHHCPNCDFDLTKEENDKKQSEFNLNQANELKNITNKGNQLVEEIKKYQSNIETSQNLIATHQANIEMRQQDITVLNDAISKIQAEVYQLEQSKEYSYVSDLTKSLQSGLEALDKNIDEEENKTYDNDGIQSAIDELKEQNIELQKTIDEYNAQQRLVVRKAVREKELVRASELLADAEYKEELLAIYNKKYLEILTLRIKKHFPGIKFQLLKDNIKEGSWQQVCYVLVESEQGLLVPYETANTASKIKIGVKIANLLGDNLGWNKLPMVIDNAEAVTRSNRYFETDAQVISLIADDLNSEQDIKNTQINNEQPSQIALEI